MTGPLQTPVDLGAATVAGAQVATRDFSGPPPLRFTRRDCLRALVAPLAAAPCGFARAAAASAGSQGLWMRLFAGASGGPVYWLARGTEYVVVDGTATPVKGRVSVIAAISRPREAGITRVAYLLQGCNLAAGSFDLLPRLTHPITGEAIPTAVTAPLRLGWNFADDGQVSEDLLAANGTRVTYRGTAWESPGSGDERSAGLRMNIRLVRPNGEVETFTEISSSRARRPSADGRSAPDGGSGIAAGSEAGPASAASPAPAASAAAGDAGPPAPAGGFIAAESETFTVRELIDKAKYGGATTVLSTSLIHAANHASVDALRRALRPGEAAALAGFFDQQAAWVRDT